MDNCDIRIDKDGLWYYLGAHMFRKDILCIFYQCVKIDEDGKYIIELGRERCYLDVEDTVFVVTGVEKIKNDNGIEQIDILLTDESREKLDLNTLYIGQDNVLYCKAKDGVFPTRFSRNAYYQLARFIEEQEDDCFFIHLNEDKFIINYV
jgi:hypothetical protein